MTPKCSLRTTQISALYTHLTRFVFLPNFVETTQISKGYADPQPRCQKEGVVEEGKFGRVLGIFALFTCVVAAAKTA